MTDQAAKDAAAQHRIVTHMQNDHHDSIIRYLQHYHHLSAWTAATGSLTAIDLNGMTFTCGNATYRTPFTPPLSSYREARERVVSMDKECLSALGKSDITISEFPPMTADFALAIAIPALTFVAYSQRWWFAPGGPVAGVLGEGFAAFSWVIQPWLCAFLWVVHGGELAYFVPHRLGAHSVNPRSGAWWKWVVAQFFAGVVCFKRFDGLVERKRVEKMKQKH